MRADRLRRRAGLVATALWLWPAGALAGVAVGPLGGEAPEERAAGAPSSAPVPPAVTDLARRQGERRPERQLTLTLFERPLTLGGEYQIEALHRTDPNLGDGDDDVLEIEQKLELELLYRLSERTWLFLEGKLPYDAIAYAEDSSERVSTLSVERGESWLYWAGLGGTRFSLQLGRQAFEEKREWWWDRDLDAIRLHWGNGALRLELGIAEELFAVSSRDEGVEPESDDLLRLLGQAEWRWAERQSLSAFAVYQHDHSPSPRVGEVLDDDREDAEDADLLWLGIGAHGRWKASSAHRLYYWLNAAAVGGSETVFDFERAGGGHSRIAQRRSADVRGFGLDLGVTWQAEWPAQPRFTIGYALGSGDRDPEAGTNRAFRQTGLHKNDGKYRGVNRFRYYGVVLEPELSNLHVGTLGLGFPLLRNSSLEVVYHVYRQVQPAPFLRDAEIDMDPVGRSRDIGQELDLVLGFEEWEHFEIEVMAGLFRAGDAYGRRSGETASGLLLKIEYSF